MTESKTNILLSMLLGLILILMVAIGGLFVKVNQLQQKMQQILVPPPEGLDLGIEAPDFVLLNVAGEEFTLASFRGQKILLFFSSTSCPYCLEMYPHIITFSEKYRTWKVIMISHGTYEENEQIVKEFGFKFPVLLLEQQVSQDYRVPGTPFFYVIDEEGIIANSGYANTLEQLDDLAEY